MERVGREENRVNGITRMLGSRGAWWVKTTGVGKAGTPDVVACYRGHFIAIEVKRDIDGSYGVTAKQRYELQCISIAGGTAFAADSVSAVEQVLDEIDACF